MYIFICAIFVWTRKDDWLVVNWPFNTWKETRCDSSILKFYGAHMCGLVSTCIKYTNLLYRAGEASNFSVRRLFERNRYAIWNYVTQDMCILTCCSTCMFQGYTSPISRIHVSRPKKKLRKLEIIGDVRKVSSLINNYCNWQLFNS